MDVGCCTMDMFQPIAMKAPPGDVPEGMKVTSLADPNDLRSAGSNPALAVGGFTLWPMSYYDNRVSFGMVMYAPNGKIVGTKEKPGARYVTQITKQGRDPDGTVVFTGQGNQSVSLTCMEIYELMTGTQSEK